MSEKGQWHDHFWIRFVVVAIVAVRSHYWRDMADPIDLWETMMLVNVLMWVVGGYALGKITRMFFDMWEQ